RSKRVPACCARPILCAVFYARRAARTLVESPMRANASAASLWSSHLSAWSHDRTSAANPKFAQVCGALGCELRVQKRHYKDRVASVLIDSEVRTSAVQMVTNVGIGTLDGPRLTPRSGPAQQLVVFLHGYGADGNDLIEIGRAWQQVLPQAAFVSPHAPEPCGQAPVGRQWFALTFRDPNERWVGVNTAAPALERFLEAELNRRNLPPSALALVGFSQGTMM